MTSGAAQSAAAAELLADAWDEPSSRSPATMSAMLASVTAVIGSALVRRAGLSVLRRLQERVGQGQLPGRELSDGASVLVSGAFLISPGFITDILGFMLLVPGVQVHALIYRFLSRRLSSRFSVITVNNSTWTGDEVPNVIDIEDIE